MIEKAAKNPKWRPPPRVRSAAAVASVAMHYLNTGALHLSEVDAKTFHWVQAYERGRAKKMKSDEPFGDDTITGSSDPSQFAQFLTSR